MFCYRYCPNATNIYTCNYRSYGCIAVERVKFSKLLSEMFKRGIDFLCENRAERAITFLNEKFIDCTMLKDSEIETCMITKKIRDRTPVTVNEMYM